MPSATTSRKDAKDLGSPFKISGAVQREVMPVGAAILELLLVLERSFASAKPKSAMRTPQSAVRSTLLLSMRHR